MYLLTMSMEWICKRCFHSTTTKSNLLSHLRNKKQCSIDTENGGNSISIQDYIDKLLEPKHPKKYSCPHCESRFSYNQSMNKHIRGCQDNPANKKDDKDKIIEDLQAKIAKYEQQGQSSHITTTNNNNTIINNTIINNIIIKNNFGSEDTSYITDDFIKYCIENPTRGLPKLIDTIHFNTEHEENHNVRCKSLKKNVFEKLVDSEWTLCDASNTLDELIKKGYRIMNTYYMENIHNNDEILDNEIQQARYQIFRFLSDKSCSEYFAVKRELRLLVKTKTDVLYVLAVPQDQIVPVENV